MPLQKEGVILAVEGAKQFIAQLKDATAQYEQFVGSLDEGGDQAAQMSGGLAALGGSAGKAGTAIAGLSTTVIAVGAAVAGAAVGIGLLTKAMVDLAKQTAPIEGLQNQFATLTATVEGGSAAMLSALRAGSQGMVANRDLMQQYNLAASLVNKQFAETLPESMGLVSKAAAATGQDMGYLMDSLVRGVGRVSPLILDNLGIQVAVSEATARASAMFGKEADALSKTEQQTALSVLALEKLREKYGQMPSTAGSAAQQMAVFNANLQNIRDTLGQYLLPALSSFLQGINALLSAFSAAISEGGALYPILVKLGAALTIAADAFQYLAHRAAQWLDDLNISWTQNMGGMAESAIRWGAEIVTNFAVGIVDAANVVLTWAMQQIQNILMWWLAPGSPPRVAPDLDKWGIAAFESYLRGMTEADFGVLESVQGPLKKLLEGPEFADVTKAVSGALAGGDRAGALDILARSSQQFGDDIAELARREFALADATNAVTEAEEKLAEAQERVAASSGKVSAATDTYNEMLRAGASEEALQAQLARINAAEEETRAAHKDVAASEAGVDAAKERVDALKEQVDWQQRFLEQLFGIQDALTEEQRAQAAARATAGARAGAGAKGGAGAGLAGLPGAILPAGPGGIGGAIAGAIETAKQRMLEGLGKLWDDIKSQFVKKWKDAIGALSETWDKFVATVGAAWDRLKEKYPVLQDIEDWIVGLPEKISTLITEGWEKLQGALDDVWSFITTYVTPVLTDLKDIVLEGLKGKVLDVALAWVGPGGLLEGLQAIKDFWDDHLGPILKEAWPTALEFLRITYIKPFTDAINLLKKGLEAAHKVLGDFLDRLRRANLAKVDALIGHSPSPLAIGIQTAADAMERMAQVSIPRFQSALAFQPAGVGATYRAAGSVSTTNNNSFNFNTTNNAGIDAVAFEAMVLRTVRRALAGAT